jgi:hypothetical protein
VVAGCCRRDGRRRAYPWMQYELPLTLVAGIGHRCGDDCPATGLSGIAMVRGDCWLPMMSCGGNVARQWACSGIS